MPMTHFVRIRTQVEGLHRWPQATAPDAYLGSAHRHLFVAELDIEVFHDDREIEINALTRWLTELLPIFGAPNRGSGEPVDFGAQSCEQLATRLACEVLDRFGHHRWMRCAVLEDGILGGGIDCQPDQADPTR